MVRASQKEVKVKPKELKYKEDSDEEINWGDSDDEGSAYPTIEKKNIIPKGMLLSRPSLGPSLTAIGAVWCFGLVLYRYWNGTNDFGPQECRSGTRHGQG